MRAVVLNSFDGIDGLELSEVDDAETGEGEVPVTVRAAALGPWDLAGAKGAFKDVGGAADLPADPGLGLRRARPTRASACSASSRRRSWASGSFAEKLSVPPAVLAGLPDEISFEDGAALPVAAADGPPDGQCAYTSRRTISCSSRAPPAASAARRSSSAAPLNARVVAAVRAKDADAARELGAEAGVRDRP